MTTNQNLPRFAGLLYLVIIVSGIYAEFFIRSNLIVPFDSVATVNAIMSSETLFRIGFAADLVMILSDIAIALVFYQLFKPISEILALTASFFRLVQAAALAMNSINLYIVLQFSTASPISSAFSQTQTRTLTMMYLEIHRFGYAIGLLFFAFSLLVLGYLIIKSGTIPKPIGFLLIAAAFGYMFDSFANVLLADYNSHQDLFTAIVFIPAFVAELAFCLWLLLKGTGKSKNTAEVNLEAALSD